MISKEEIFQISSKKEFEKITLKVFRHQFDHNLVYQQFCNLLNKNKANVKILTDIPFLPIQFFKSHQVLSSTQTVQQTFTSSGTTGMTTSQHLVTDVSWYEESYRKAFAQFYGNIEDYAVIALLPSYLERQGSSLIYMVSDLIKIEFFLIPGTIICADGRAANVQFLLKNFKREWLYYYHKLTDMHLMYLNAPSLGHSNNNRLKFYNS